VNARVRAFVDWIVPIAILIGLTIPFWTTHLDESLAARFYTPGVGWVHGSEQPWAALKQYGVIPAWITLLGALSVLVASIGMRRARPHRRAAMFLVFAMALGPGLLVNTVFKQHWGRPRPSDLVEFGGDRAYVKPWVKHAPHNGGSFPSGHAATGFYLLVPYFLLRGRWRGRALGFLALGLAYGSLMGFARMMQGAHFASDVLWSLGFVYLTGLALVYLLHPERPPNPRAG
jgi:lipid A 4'-phosphatase